MYAHVENSLILTIKDIAIFAAKFPTLFLEIECVCQFSFAYETVAIPDIWTWNFRIEFDWGPCSSN